MLVLMNDFKKERLLQQATRNTTAHLSRMSEERSLTSIGMFV